MKLAETGTLTAPATPRQRTERHGDKAERCGRAAPMPMASPEAPPSMEAALSSRASSRALPGCCLVPPAL